MEIDRIITLVLDAYDTTIVCTGIFDSFNDAQNFFWVTVTDLSLKIARGAMVVLRRLVSVVTEKNQVNLEIEV